MGKVRKHCGLGSRCLAPTGFVLLLIVLLAASLAACAGRHHPRQPVFPVISPEQPSDQNPDDPNGNKGSASEIILEPHQFHLSRLIEDIDAARKQGASKDTAVVTSVMELLAVDLIDTETTGVTPTPLSVQASEVWAEDFDGDGYDDVLAGGTGVTFGDPIVSIVLQNGGLFTEYDAVLSYQVVTTVFPFHLDYYDDVMDLVCTDKLSCDFIGLFSASGDLEPYFFSAGGSRNDMYYSCAAKSDIDLNGSEDVALAVFGSKYFHVHFGYVGTVEEEEGFDPRGLNLGITADKSMKVIPDESTATEDEDVLAAINQGTLELTPYRVTLGDFNGDELPDVALLCRALTVEMDGTINGIVYRCNSFLVVQLNNGVPEGKTENLVTFTMSEASLVGPGGEDIGAADFDQDGNLDLVLSVSEAKVIATARGRGDGTFEDFVYWPLGNYHPYRLAIGEFDDEEGVDAVMTCPLEQTLMYALNRSREE